MWENILNNLYKRFTVPNNLSIKILNTIEKLQELHISIEYKEEEIKAFENLDNVEKKLI